MERVNLVIDVEMCKAQKVYRWKYYPYGESQESWILFSNSNLTAVIFKNQFA